MEGHLVCSGSSSDFHIVRGIPRFIRRELTPAETAEAFGMSGPTTHN
jgi:uncharacterized protein YbaR (Trm112 family)